MAGGDDFIKFKTFKGSELPCLDWLSLMDFVSDHRRTTRIVEAAAINMAMVTRHAVGANASNGRIAGLLTDSLAGWVAAATLRHLAHSGAEVVGIKLNEPISPNFRSELDLLGASGTQIFDCSDNLDITEFHAVLAGIIDSNTNLIKEKKNLWHSLNENAVPLLSVFPPISEISKNEPLLYASATMFLGLPLAMPENLKDILGRSYLCDISLTRQVDCGAESKSLFSEQPVIQIYPSK